MERFKQILSSISEAAQKTYKGKKRSELKNSDFLFPDTKSFPIVSPVDVPDAINNFGRMKGPMTYDAFLKKLYTFVKRKGPEFVAALPEATKDRLGINKKSKAGCPFSIGNMVRNINPDCVHYMSEGIVTAVKSLPDNMGNVVSYKTTNAGKTWTVGTELTKTEIQLAAVMEDPLLDKQMDLMDLHAQPEMEEEDDDEEDEDELSEYKQDFLAMNIGSLNAIATHALEILRSIDSDPHVKENLTESWIQGKIAITEDYMRTIHDFVRFVPQNDDTSWAENKPGLWENIRRKKQKEGKNYKPAKPGDPDRPDREQWKRLTK